MTDRQDPDEIRADIERTRARLSRDVDAIGDTVRPSNVVARQKDKARGALSDLKDRVMGSDDDDWRYASRPAHERDRARYGEYQPYDDRSEGRLHAAGDRASESLHAAREQVGESLDSARESLAHAPEAARRQMQGNPLAAGLIAFGVGWLAASLIPSTRREQELAQTAQQKAQPLLQEAQETAKEMVEEFKPAAQHAVDEVKSTATQGVESVKAEGQDAAHHVRDDAVQAKDSVQRQRD